MFHTPLKSLTCCRCVWLISTNFLFMWVCWLLSLCNIGFQHLKGCWISFGNYYFSLNLTNLLPIQNSYNKREAQLIGKKISHSSKDLWLFKIHTMKGNKSNWKHIQYILKKSLVLLCVSYHLTSPSLFQLTKALKHFSTKTVTAGYSNASISYWFMASSSATSISCYCWIYYWKLFPDFQHWN